MSMCSVPKMGGWIAPPTDHLVLTASKPRWEGRVCGSKCLKTSLPYYHMHVQAGGEESSPDRSLQRLFAVLTGDVEEGGCRTLASCWDAGGGLERRLKALGHSWEIAQYRGSSQFLGECVWSAVDKWVPMVLFWVLSGNGRLWQ